MGVEPGTHSRQSRKDVRRSTELNMFKFGDNVDRDKTATIRQNRKSTLSSLSSLANVYRALSSSLDGHLSFYRENAPTLASCSFDKHGLILIIFGDQHQHTFNKKLSYRWQTARCWFVKLLRYGRIFLSEYVDKKFTYICYRRLIKHDWIYCGSKNWVIYNS